MSGPVAIGVIGAGVISTQYLENLRAAADVDVRMVADLDTTRAAARAAEFGVPDAGSVDDLLARDDIEIVVNLTIPAAHAPVGIAAIESGKHVFSEKPYALDRDSGARLRAAATAAGLRVACAPDTLLGAGLQTARRLIDDGAIGAPLTAFAMFQVPGPEGWHPSPEFFYLRGGGPHFDMGPYYLAALVQSLGPAASVVARGSRSRDERVIGSGPKAGTVFPVEVPTHIAGIVDFADGVTAQVTFSFQSEKSRTGIIEISGAEGTIALPDPNGFGGDIELWRPEHERPTLVAPVGSQMSRGHGVVELARAIRADRPERLSSDLALHVLDLMCSLEDSAEQGATVRLSTTTNRPEALPEDWDPYASTL